MPGMLQQITTTGYGYVAPTLDKARNYVPLLDGAVQRMEPITAAVIQKADGYVDAGYAVVDRRTIAVRGTISAVRGSVYEKTSPVVDRVVDLKTVATGKVLNIYNENPIILRAHQTGLSFCDTTEALIDRLLPEPATEAKKEGKEGEEAVVATRALIPRTIALPFRIPARTIHIVAFKMDGVTDRIVVKAQWVVQLTKDQKCKLSAHIAENSRQLMDKVSNSSAVVTLQNGRSAGARKLEVARQSLANGQHAVAVKCYIVCERFRLIELKDVTFEKADQLQCLAVSAAKSASQGAYTVTKRFAGDERATVIFTKISEKVPMVKSAIFPEASTGSLEAMSPAPVPQAAQAGTGDSAAAGQVAKPPVVPEMPQLQKKVVPEVPQLKKKQGLWGFDPEHGAEVEKALPIAK